MTAEGASCQSGSGVVKAYGWRGCGCRLPGGGGGSSLGEEQEMSHLLSGTRLPGDNVKYVTEVFFFWGG